MAFVETRLPEEIERGAQGGPRFKTTIIPLSSGFEKRNQDWENARQSWDIGYGVMDRSGVAIDTPYFEDLVAFFYARRGRLHGFRFKDWTDFEMADQSIGTTDASTATFQIFKRYTETGVNYDRTIKKPVASSVGVTVNSVTIAEGAGTSEFQVDTTTGIITLGATLAAQTGTDVTASCEFDIPVRFDVDQLQLSALLYNAASIPNIPVVEILLA